MGFRLPMGGLIRSVSNVVAPELPFRRKEYLSTEETEPRNGLMTTVSDTLCMTFFTILFFFYLSLLNKYLNEYFSDWLIIQASAEVMMEGESLFLRCHSWKNLNVFKVIYYKDNKALKYWYENHNISITNVTEGNSGIYYCVGRIQRLPYISNKLKIIVKKRKLVKEREWVHIRGKEKEHLSLMQLKL